MVIISPQNGHQEWFLLMSDIVALIQASSGQLSPSLDVDSLYSACTQPDSLALTYAQPKKAKALKH
jgi:hypothetical protein